MTLRTALPESPIGIERHTFEVPCRRCNKKINMTVQASDYKRWKGGMNVQVAFPYLSPKFQELLVNGICAECIDAEVASEKEEPDR